MKDNDDDNVCHYFHVVSLVGNFISSAAKELNQGLSKQIQLVIRVGIELRITRFQVQCPNHLDTLSP